MTSPRIRIVTSFEELVGTPFEGDVNALCWPREPAGDFGEIIAALATAPGIATVAEDDLTALALSPAGAAAREVLLADQAMMRRHGLDPALNCITGHPRDTGGGPIPTDVASFHVDRATDPLDTYLCTYCGPGSEGLPNEMAVRRINVTETRAQLLAAYGGADDAGFAGWLVEHYFDLHYAALPGAEPYAFAAGHLWRIAIDYPGCRVPPCIHRAPLSTPGTPARLLLIS